MTSDNISLQRALIRSLVNGDDVDISCTNINANSANQVLASLRHSGYGIGECPSATFYRPV